MAETHDEFCDGQHKERQACNRALELADVGPTGIEAHTAWKGSTASPETVLEAPLAAGPAIAVEPRVMPAEDSGALEPGVRPLDLGEMPAPSPWAVRAWEDTAAAVGATASPAPPPRMAADETESETHPPSMAGHMPLLVGLAVAAALALFVGRRRRS